MRVFYVRCSTMEQNEARQLKMAEEQNAEKVFVDKASGKNTNRAAFKEMMAFVRAGDTVVVERFQNCAKHAGLAFHRVRTDRKGRGVRQSEREHRHHHPAGAFHADRVRRAG